MFKKVLGSVAICTITLTTVGGSLPLNYSAIANEYDDIGSRDYQEIQGTYLLVHFTGVDEKGNFLAYPKYLEIPLHAGELINKEVLENKVRQTLKAHGDDAYEFVSFTKNTKLEMHYNNLSVPYTISEEGFKVDDYSKYKGNVQFRLSGDVIIKPKKVNETKTQYSENTDVKLIQEITFKKRSGNSDTLIPTNMGKEVELNKSYKVGNKVNEDELFQEPQRVFKETQEYKQGYKLVKRLNTTVIENGRTKNEIFDHLYNPIFNYTISSLREKPTSEGHIDFVSEDYYISKAGDDYMPEQQEISIELKDSIGTTLKTVIIKVGKSNIEEEIKKYIKENGLDTINSKNGNSYKFNGEIKKENNSYSVIYK